MSIIANQLNKHQVKLCFYQPEQFDALCKFYLPEEQKRYTCLPSEVLEVSIKDIERHPIVIMKDDNPVGFIVLHEGEGIKPYFKEQGGMLLRAFSINYSEQGKGLAKMAMELLPSFVKVNFPHICEIVLAVNAKNNAAIRLYEKAGF